MSSSKLSRPGYFGRNPLNRPPEESLKIQHFACNSHSFSELGFQNPRRVAYLRCQSQSWTLGYPGHHHFDRRQKRTREICKRVVRRRSAPRQRDVDALARISNEQSIMAIQEDEDIDGNIVWEDPGATAAVEDYIFQDGNRLVRPYYFEFVAHVKKRWIGRVMVDVYTQEFRGRPREYYIRAVERGRLRVNGRRVSPDHVLRDSEKLSHFVHRHEPPVKAEPVRILEDKKGLITVCKPASIPVHPCGQYRKNTILGILEAEHQTGPLFPIHRLDRLVSGLLILARSAEAADGFREEIEAGRIQKRYVAKVKGIFPDCEVEVDAPIYYDKREGVSSVEPTGSRAKAALTRFRRLSTDGVCSVVRCEPVTGRTHQIRVHLRHLGHPVANDDLYLQATLPKRSTEGLRVNPLSGRLNSEGSLRSKPCTSLPGEQNEQRGDVGRSPALDASEEDVVDLFISKNDSRTLEGDRGGNVHEAISSELAESDLKSGHREVHSGTMSEQDAVSTKKNHCSSQGSPTMLSNVVVANLECETGRQFPLDPFCTNCPNLGPLGYPNEEEGLWLHCVRYASPSWAFECPLPAWAS